MRQALVSINRTEDQKTKIKEIYQTAHAHRDAEPQEK